MKDRSREVSPGNPPLPPVRESRRARNGSVTLAGAVAPGWPATSRPEAKPPRSRTPERRWEAALPLSGVGGNGRTAACGRKNPGRRREEGGPVRTAGAARPPSGERRAPVTAPTAFGQEPGPADGAAVPPARAESFAGPTVPVKPAPWPPPGAVPGRDFPGTPGRGCLAATAKVTGESPWRPLGLSGKSCSAPRSGLRNAAAPEGGAGRGNGKAEGIHLNP
jgi:hypothetical protein